MSVPPAAIVAAARAAHKTYPVPVSVMLAQWALESAWGRSVSGKNNYGGITAKVKGAVFPFVPGTPLEPATLCWTHEDWQKKRVRCQRWFKDFASPADYFVAHSKLLATAPVYAPAMRALPSIERFVALMAAHYATDPHYAETLMAIIRGSKLTAYDA